MDDKYKRRFWGRVAKTDGGCWEWQGGKKKRGYGQFYINRKPKYVHRVMWEIVYGAIPKGLCVCHCCDNPSCVNPGHLFFGTQGDNVRDMINKGRFRSASLCGERNGYSKLTDGEVRSIKKQLMLNLTLRAIAEKYGVDTSTIWKIKHGISWTHLNE